MTKRLVIGQISHETNTFSPIATDLERFAQRSLAFGEDVLSSACGTRTGIGGYIDAAGGDVELIPAVAACMLFSAADLSAKPYQLLVWAGGGAVPAIPGIEERRVQPVPYISYTYKDR
ncbi:MAG: M81 family metallopeptidase, partial [Bacillota bacterium]